MGRLGMICTQTSYSSQTFFCLLKFNLCCLIAEIPFEAWLSHMTTVIGT